jgi:hypothetical protein
MYNRPQSPSLHCEAREYKATYCESSRCLTRRRFELLLKYGWPISQVWSPGFGGFGGCVDKSALGWIPYRYQEYRCQECSSKFGSRTDARSIEARSAHPKLGPVPIGARTQVDACRRYPLFICSSEGSCFPSFLFLPCATSRILNPV